MPALAAVPRWDVPFSGEVAFDMARLENVLNIDAEDRALRELVDLVDDDTILIEQLYRQIRPMTRPAGACGVANARPR